MCQTLLLRGPPGRRRGSSAAHLLAARRAPVHGLLVGGVAGAAVLAVEPVLNRVGDARVPDDHGKPPFKEWCQLPVPPRGFLLMREASCCLDQAGEIWSRVGDSHPSPSLTRRAHRCLCFRGLEPTAGVEPALPPYQGGGLPLSYAGELWWARPVTLRRLLHVTEAVFY
jgi:hypothetical protein